MMRLPWQRKGVTCFFFPWPNNPQRQIQWHRWITRRQGTAVFLIFLITVHNCLDWGGLAWTELQFLQKSRQYVSPSFTCAHKALLRGTLSTTVKGGRRFANWVLSNRFSGRVGWIVLCNLHSHSCFTHFPCFLPHPSDVFHLFRPSSWLFSSPPASSTPFPDPFSFCSSSITSIVIQALACLSAEVLQSPSASLWQPKGLQGQVREPPSPWGKDRDETQGFCFQKISRSVKIWCWV